MSLMDDRILLSKARRASRTLLVLATLATCGAVALICILFLAKGIPLAMMTIMVAAISLIAAGYWELTVAAQRGNPNSVGIVIAILVIQMTLTLIYTGVAAARAGTGFQPNLSSFVIPTLILVVLYYNRKVLLELQRRGLWDQAFGSAKPSARLCVIGGTVLAVGFVILNSCSLVISWKAGQEQLSERRHVQAFIQMIEGDEREFLAAMQALSENHDPERLEAALAKVNALETKVKKWSKKPPEGNHFSPS